MSALSQAQNLLSTKTWGFESLQGHQTIQRLTQKETPLDGGASIVCAQAVRLDGHRRYWLVLVTVRDASHRRRSSIGYTMRPPTFV